MTALISQLRSQAESLGFCALGAAPARLEDVFLKRLEHKKTPFVRHSPRHRCGANHWLTGARAVLAVAWPYHHRYAGAMSPPAGKGYFSPFAAAPDYHSQVGQKLKQLAEIFKRTLPGSRWFVQVDNGPGCERLYALRAGVGWQGKNNFIIVPGHGSLVWLGLLATDAEVDPGQPLDSQCGHCRLCLDACPSGAFSSANSLEVDKCLAFWASDRSSLSDAQCRLMAEHKTIYGCDLCQLVCPHTITSGETAIIWPDLADILGLTESGFRQQYGNTAAAWRGRNLLMRNAAIAAAGQASLASLLEDLCSRKGMVGRYAQRALKGF